MMLGNLACFLCLAYDFTLAFSLVKRERVHVRGGGAMKYEEWKGQKSGIDWRNGLYIIRSSR